MKSFNVIPAIDILNGKCVRLTQGKYEEVEEFSDNLEETAKKWVSLGAGRLHVVDLDGAKEGRPINLKAILKVRESVNIKIQVGGGIRDIFTLEEYINEGIDYVVLGTKVFQDKDFLNRALSLSSEKVIIGLDLKNKKIALSGWKETMEMEINELADYLKEVKQVIFTDTSKDGTLSGPNIKYIEEIASALKSNIIASGGFSNIEDLKNIIELKKQKCSNLSGVILGKSLYKGAIDLKTAIQLVDKELEQAK